MQSISWKSRAEGKMRFLCGCCGLPLHPTQVWHQQGHKAQLCNPDFTLSQLRKDFGSWELLCNARSSQIITSKGQRLGLPIEAELVSFPVLGNLGIKQCHWGRQKGWGNTGTPGRTRGDGCEGPILNTALCVCSIPAAAVPPFIPSWELSTFLSLRKCALHANLYN